MTELCPGCFVWMYLSYLPRCLGVEISKATPATRPWKPTKELPLLRLWHVGVNFCFGNGKVLGLHRGTLHEWSGGWRGYGLALPHLVKFMGLRGGLSTRIPSLKANTNFGFPGVERESVYTTPLSTDQKLLKVAGGVEPKQLCCFKTIPSCSKLALGFRSWDEFALTYAQNLRTSRPTMTNDKNNCQS